ncbi:MAG: hypothetical protein QM726_17750 [Chitinophagaceae bacterium]
MFCIYSLYTKGATKDNIFLKKILLLCMFCFGCNGKQSAIDKANTNYAQEIMQVKKMPAGNTALQLLPAADKAGHVNGFCNMRILLTSNHALKKPGIMQYMNFDIKSSFYVVKGSDTLLPAICERIPGANENDFLYLTCFDKQKLLAGNADSRLCVADTIAGFGNADFLISNNVLKQLDAIKN